MISCETRLEFQGQAGSNGGPTWPAGGGGGLEAILAIGGNGV